MSIRDESLVYLIKKTWEFSKGRRYYMLAFFIMFIIANLIDFLQPLVLAKVINIIQLQGVNDSNIYTIIGYISLFILIDLVFWVFHGTARYIERLNSFHININFRKKIFGGVLDLPAIWHNENQSGDTIDKIHKSSFGITSFSSESFMIISTIVRFISSVGAIIYFNLYSVFAILFLVIFSLITIKKFDTILRKQYTELYKFENGISAKIYDSISNITTIIILKIEKLILNDIMKALFKPFSLYKKNAIVNEVKWFIVSMIASSFLVMVLGGFILVNYLNGDIILIGTLSALFIYSDRVNHVFFQFAWQYEQLLRHKTAIQNADPLFSEIKSNNKRVPKREMESRWKKISIKDLVFSYEKDGSKVHLQKIWFEINKKEKVALIGESGSGKTTFLKILRGLYEPKSLNITVDGKEIKRALRKVNNKSMLIPQEPEIFATTIRENITMGIKHRLSYIKKFSDMATFTKVVDNLPNKWNSKINEKGVNLSGGEKQRLALARALLASEDKDILLMDESTSSVDTKNELKIYKGIFKKYGKKTIIATIHKYYLLPLFDRIVLFDKGRVVASGSFEDLMKDSKKFRQLWNKYKDIRD